MEVKKVIKQVATLLQLTNVINVNFDDFENADSQTKKDVNLILSSINEVLSDVAIDFIPLKTSENITVSGGTFDLTNLTNAFYKLVKVHTKKKYVVDFETLIIENGSYKVDYLYLPDEYELADDIEEFDNRLTIYNLSYGVAAEFCAISGNYSEAEMWNSKFINSMENCKKRKIADLKQRRWLWEKQSIHLSKA